MSNLAHNPVLAQAADRASSLGGAHTGVYLLCGHPLCDWDYTLTNPHNKHRCQGCSPSSFEGKRDLPVERQKL
eukprot:6761581-Prorocentrum_lima.AAC.1